MSNEDHRPNHRPEHPEHRPSRESDQLGEGADPGSHTGEQGAPRPTVNRVSPVGPSGTSESAGGHAGPATPYHGPGPGPTPIPAPGQHHQPQGPFAPQPGWDPRHQPGHHGHVHPQPHQQPHHPGQPHQPQHDAQHRQAHAGQRVGRAHAEPEGPVFSVLNIVRIPMNDATVERFWRSVFRLTTIAIVGLVIVTLFFITVPAFRSVALTAADDWNTLVSSGSFRGADVQLTFDRTYHFVVPIASDANQDFVSLNEDLAFIFGGYTRWRVEGGVWDGNLGLIEAESWYYQVSRVATGESEEQAGAAEIDRLLRQHAKQKQVYIIETPHATPDQNAAPNGDSGGGDNGDRTA